MSTGVSCGDCGICTSMPPGLAASRPVLAASGAAAGAAAAGGSSAAIAPPGSVRRLTARTTSQSVAKRRFRLEKERDGTGMGEPSTPVKDPRLLGTDPEPARGWEHGSDNKIGIARWKPRQEILVAPRAK